MKEKYSSYYKKLKCFQDPVENPDLENEGEQNLVKDDVLFLNKKIAVGGNYTKARRKLMSFGPKIRQRDQSTKSSVKNGLKNTRAGLFESRLTLTQG